MRRPALTFAALFFAAQSFSVPMRADAPRVPEESVYELLTLPPARGPR